jgi:hypothetical protein
MKRLFSFEVVLLLFSTSAQANLVVLLAAALCLVGAPAYAGVPKVDTCHVPPGDPESFHTIRISQSALEAHLGHGDLAGACNALCAELCDDGDACTIDDTGDCEDLGCPAVRLPVDCSDGNLCTADLCDPVAGCSNPVVVTCTPLDLCTTSACDPVTGSCVETATVCPEGEQCDPETGLCTITSGDCFDAFAWAGTGQQGIDECVANAGCAGVVYPEFPHLGTLSGCGRLDSVAGEPDWKCTVCFVYGHAGHCQDCQGWDLPSDPGPVLPGFSCTNVCS